MDAYAMTGGFNADTPDNRNYAAETQNNLSTQVKEAPQVLAAEQQYQPAYAQLSMDTMSRIAPQYAQLLTQLQPQMNAAADAARSGTVASLGKLGPQMYQDLVNYDPMGSKLLDDAGTAAEGYMNGEMDPFQRRGMTQDVRSAEAARGFGTGGNDASTEALYMALNRDALRRYGIATAQSVAGQRAQTYDPYLSALMGMSGTGGGVMGAAGGMKGGPSLFNPDDPYAAALYGMNYQGRNQVNLSNAQGQLSAANNEEQAMASVVGAGVKAGAGGCWVAREVFGQDNPKWQKFREWLFTRGPEWFRDLYLARGERFARLIQNKPKLKMAIAQWMESKIATMEVA